MKIVDILADFFKILGPRSHLVPTSVVVPNCHFVYMSPSYFTNCLFLCWFWFSADVLPTFWERVKLVPKRTGSSAYSQHSADIPPTYLLRMFLRRPFADILRTFWNRGGRTLQDSEQSPLGWPKLGECHSKQFSYIERKKIVIVCYLLSAIF